MVSPPQAGPAEKKSWLAPAQAGPAKEIHDSLGPSRPAKKNHDSLPGWPGPGLAWPGWAWLAPQIIKKHYVSQYNSHGEFPVLEPL